MIVPHTQGFTGIVKSVIVPHTQYEHETTVKKDGGSRGQYVFGRVRYKGQHTTKKRSAKIKLFLVLKPFRYQFVVLVTVSKEYCRNSSGYLNILDRQPKVFSFSYSYVTKITLEVCELFSLSSCSLEM